MVSAIPLREHDEDGVIADNGFLDPRIDQKGEERMKVCFPTETLQGLDSRVYGHFGSAPGFVIVDTGTRYR